MDGWSPIITAIWATQHLPVEGDNVVFATLTNRCNPTEKVMLKLQGGEPGSDTGNRIINWHPIEEELAFLEPVQMGVTEVLNVLPPFSANDNNTERQKKYIKQVLSCPRCRHGFLDHLCATLRALLASPCSQGCAAASRWPAYVLASLLCSLCFRMTNLTRLSEHFVSFAVRAILHPWARNRRICSCLAVSALRPV